MPTSRTWLLLSALVLAGPGAAAQDAPAPAPAPAAPAPATPELDNPHQVDHWARRPAAQQLLKHADARFKAGGADGLRDAVTAWLRIARDHGSLLMPTAPDPEALHEHFRSLDTVVRDRLAALTDAQRTSMADLLELPAQRALASARRSGDATAMELCAARYPWSQSAFPALVAAGDLRLEQGAAGAAAWCYRQALALRGDRGRAAGPAVVLRCARALAVAGRATELRALADRLAKRDPEFTLPGAGGPVAAAAELRRLAATVRPASHTWPEPDPSGGPGAAPPPLSKVQITWGKDRDAPVMRLGTPIDHPPAHSPFLPVAADGLVILNCRGWLEAIDLVHLSVAWKSDGSPREERWDPIHAAPWSLGAAISGSTVAAVLDYPGVTAGQGGQNRVVLLDLHTGEPRATELDSQQVQRMVDRRAVDFELRFTGVPVWRGGRLFVGAVRRHTDDAKPAEAFVYGFRPVRRAGEWSWEVATRTYVTTEAQKHQRRGGIGDPGCTLVDGGDRLIAATNLGTVAALDPLTGHVQWLVKYRLAGGTTDPTPSFWPGRPLLGPATISFGPADSDSLYVLDRDTGALVFGAVGEVHDPAPFERDLPEARRSGPWRSVLGIRHDRLFVQRDRSIEIFGPEREFVVGRRRLFGTERPVKSDDQQVPVEGHDGEPPQIMGRPAFGADGVALAGGSTLSLLAVRRVTDDGGGEHIAMTGDPIDDLQLHALPVAWGARHGPQTIGRHLAGACLRIDGWGVPRVCRQTLPSAPDGEPERCLAPLGPATGPGTPVTCRRCGHAYPAARVRYLVMVSRDYLTAFQLAPPPAGTPGGSHGR